MDQKKFRIWTLFTQRISSTKGLYYENIAKKLNNSLLQAKTYWLILNTFYRHKEIPLIPPLFVDNTFVTDNDPIPGRFY